MATDHKFIIIIPTGQDVHWPFAFNLNRAELAKFIVTDRKKIALDVNQRHLHLTDDDAICGDAGLCEDFIRAFCERMLTLMLNPDTKKIEVGREVVDYVKAEAAKRKETARNASDN